MKDKIISLKIKNPQLIAMWWSVKKILEDNVNTGYKKEFLFATMEFLASKQAKTKRKVILLYIDTKTATMIWGCLKTVLDNSLVENKDQLDAFFDSITMLAFELDKK